MNRRFPPLNPGVPLAVRRLRAGNPLALAAQYGLPIWLRADMGVTLGSTLLAEGTSPPVWTISGTPTRQVGLHLEIDSVAGGTGLGQATYKWSENNGATYVATGVVTAAGPTALGTTGLSVSQAAGPYNINNKWDATVLAWADQSGNGRNVAQGTPARQPKFILSDTTGRPSISGDGVDDFMNTASFATAQPSTVFLVMKMVTVQSPGSNHDTVWSRGGTPFMLIDSTPRTILSAGANITYAGAVANGAHAIIEMVLNGASGELVENGVVRASGDVGTDPGGLLTLFSLNVGIAHSVTANISELIEFSSVLPAAVRASVRTRLSNIYGVAL